MPVLTATIPAPFATAAATPNTTSEETSIPVTAAPISTASRGTLTSTPRDETASPTIPITTTETRTPGEMTSTSTTSPITTETLTPNQKKTSRGVETSTPTSPMTTHTTSTQIHVVALTVDPVKQGCQDADIKRIIPRGKVYFKEVGRNINDKNVLGGCMDIVVIVDESASMRREHEWLKSTIPLLEESLRRKGVGVGETNRNRYGLFGFARNVPGQDYHVVIPVGDGIMGSADEFSDAVKKLTLSGSIEDGYEAIRLALESYPFRRQCVVQFILLTDEDRDVYNRDLSYEGVRGWLQRRNITLNAILKQKFVKDGERAFGVYYNGTAFVSKKADYYLDRGFQLVQTTGNTIEHYVALAFETKGAAWDLSRLRREGNTATAFTKAFIDLSVEMIGRRFLTCYRCVCSFSDALDCIRVYAATCPQYTVR